jgi:hypothetical protein
MRVLLAAAFVSLLACTTVQTAGAYRNPQHETPSGTAVTVGAIACSDDGAPTDIADAQRTQLDDRLHASLPFERVDGVVSWADACRALARDRALYQDLVFGSDWSVPAALKASIQQLARSKQAASVYVPLLRAQPRCERSDGPVRDTRITRENAAAFPELDCADISTDIAVFQFDAEGRLVWKSSGTTGEAVAQNLDAVVGRVIADVSQAQPHARDTATAIESPGATQ